MKKPTKLVMISLTPEQHRLVKFCAWKREVTMREFIMSAILMALEKADMKNPI